MSFEFFLPYDAMLMETKTIRAKRIKNSENPQTWSGDMVDRCLSPKFGVNPPDGFQENDVYGRTDGRTTDDRRPRHDISSAVQ